MITSAEVCLPWQTGYAAYARFCPDALARHRTLKHHRPGPAQRVPLRMSVRMLHRMSIRVPIRIYAIAHVPHMPVAIAARRAIRRRRLRQPRRVTDRAERRRHRADVVADRL